MGGDFGPAVTVPAAMGILVKYPSVKLILVGQESVIAPLANQHGAALADRWQIHHASEVVGMDELPSQALRGKKDSSMRVAINLVKMNQAQACVSAGNTGALMATARYVLKTLPGIDRPAIMTRFPTRIGTEVRMLDLGANVDSSAEQLYQFALMGAISAACVDEVDNPRIGLLNVGVEEIKGNEQVKGAADLLSANKNLNYIGYIEGDKIFSGCVDVIVCDGFVGNITLKSIEGLVKLLYQLAKEAFNKNWLTRLSVLPALPVLKQLQKRIDPRRRNGAILLGLNGIVVKSHGGADQVAFACAIEEAIVQVEKNIAKHIRDELSRALEE